MPYERIVQWVAGPFSGLVGVLAVKATDHLSFLGQTGLGRSTIAHAIQNATVFGVTSLVTYAAHHKWLTNLATWWNSPQPTAVTTDPPPVKGEPPTPVEVVPSPGGIAGNLISRQELQELQTTASAWPSTPQEAQSAQ